MDSEIIGILFFILLFILLFAGMPIGFALLLTGFLGLVSCFGVDATLYQLGMVPYSSVASDALCVVPLFMLTGTLASRNGIIDGMYDAAYKWTGTLPGGLAITSIGACAGFSACTGSSMASAATMTQVAWPEMKRYHYKASLGLGSIAAGGTLGILIPPSIPFIFYGILTEQSVGKLFLAGIIPGVLLSLFFMIYIIVKVKIDPSLAPAGPKTSWNERLIALRNLIPGAILIIIILGGIWSGIFSPTEAGGVSAFSVVILSLVTRGLTWKGFTESLKMTVKITAMASQILIGSMLFNYFITASGLTELLVNFVQSLAFTPTGILVVILAIYVFLGCLMESLALTLLTIPIVFPIITRLGIDPILFGTLFVLTMEMSLVTPPIGMNIFVMGGMIPDVPMYAIFRGVLPFVFIIAFMVLLVMMFPQLALFLPNHVIN